jgi:hypothetical protein
MIRLKLRYTTAYDWFGGSARTDNVNEAIARVYNREIRQAGSPRCHVALREKIADGTYIVQMGHACNDRATCLDSRMVVHIDSN